MALDSLRQRVMFHNSVDVWIAACQERDAEWSDAARYRRFIAYLRGSGLALKAFNLCAHDAGATEEKKTRFAEELAESKDNPDSAVYTVRLTDQTLGVIRSHDFA